MGEEGSACGGARQDRPRDAPPPRATRSFVLSNCPACDAKSVRGHRGVEPGELARRLGVGRVGRTSARRSWAKAFLSEMECDGVEGVDAEAREEAANSRSESRRSDLKSTKCSGRSPFRVLPLDWELQGQET